MQMDAGLDTGPVIERVPVPIAPHDTAGALTQRLAATGAAAIVVALDRLRIRGRLDAPPQSASGATYAPKIAKSEAAIDWNRPAIGLARQVRAFDPAPGATAIARRCAGEGLAGGGRRGVAARRWAAGHRASAADADRGQRRLRRRRAADH